MSVFFFLFQSVESRAQISLIDKAKQGTLPVKYEPATLPFYQSATFNMNLQPYHYTNQLHLISVLALGVLYPICLSPINETTNILAWSFTIFFFSSHKIFTFLDQIVKICKCFHSTIWVCWDRKKNTFCCINYLYIYLCEDTVCEGWKVLSIFAFCLITTV